ncbi:MAG: hypothetical protein H5T92_08825, partial [Synergistales bacterium]|nr:hypothetical protein [Synergistales bacterium]
MKFLKKLVCNLKMLFYNPPSIPCRIDIPVSLLEDYRVSGQVLYDMARQLYRSQEESLRLIQARASSLFQISILVLTGGILGL